MSGRIEVITGCMFSGKTEELIERVKSREEEFEAVIPESSGDDNIVSHDGSEIEAIKVTPKKHTATDVVEKIDDEVEVVALDQVNLYSKLANEVCRTLFMEGKTLIVSGLDMDFRGTPFPPMGELMCVADEVVKKKAECEFCGEEANMTQRLINGRPASYEDSIIMVGGEEVYLPSCRDCHTLRDPE